MDYLSQLTDETLENRKSTFLLLKQSLRRWKSLMFGQRAKILPTIHALKDKLNAIKKSELDFQSRKISDFNLEQAEIISARIIKNNNTLII
jgi:glutamyl-tRNA reductase